MYVLNQIISEIKAINPGHGSQLQRVLHARGEDFLQYAGQVLSNFQSYWEQENLNSAFMARCYLQMREERIQNEKKLSTSDSAVDTEYLSKYRTYGHRLAQAISPEQYEGLSLFSQYLSGQGQHIRHYLEVGTSHGLYIKQAIDLLEGAVRYDVVDSDMLSMKISQALVQDERVNFLPVDFLDIEALPPYDFITLDGLEALTLDPEVLLKKAEQLLVPEGRVYITGFACLLLAHSGFLPDSQNNLHQSIEQTGFEVEAEAYHFGELLSDVSEIATDNAKPFIYSAVLRKTSFT